jgi:beta-glucosidase
MHSIAIPGSALAAIDPADLVPQEVKVPTILDSIKAVVPKVNVLHARGCGTLDEDRSGFDEAVRIAQQADVVVLVLGERSGMTPDCSTGETRDSVDLRLPGVQHALAEAIFKTEKPVVVVLVNGRPLAIPELVQKADAILEAWLPGEEGGGAVAKTLFGETNPGGRLPITFPRHVGQLPIFYNQKPSGGKSNWYTDYVTAQAKPLFPFGHGLSYTTFEYSALALSRERATSGETIDINIKVENTGSAMGDEVVQLYICDEYACSPRPIKELKGFVRLTLQPGETRCVTFHLAVDQLAFYDGNLDLVVESGRTQVMVGSSSEDIRLRDSFDIVGAKKEKVKDRIFICPVEVK